jgi:hypothetical protein
MPSESLIYGLREEKTEIEFFTLNGIFLHKSATDSHLIDITKQRVPSHIEDPIIDLLLSLLGLALRPQYQVFDSIESNSGWDCPDRLSLSDHFGGRMLLFFAAEFIRIHGMHNVVCVNYVAH